MMKVQWSSRILTSVVHRDLSSLDISKGAGRNVIQPHVERWLFAWTLVNIILQLPYSSGGSSSLVLGHYMPYTKSGDPEDVSNCHPVSLTSTISHRILFSSLIETRTFMKLSGNPIPTCQLVDDLRVQAENILFL